MPNQAVRFDRGSPFSTIVVGNRIRTIWGTKAHKKRRRHRFRARKQLCGFD